MQENIYDQNWQKARAQALKAGLQIVEHGWEQHVIIDETRGIVYRYPRHRAASDKLNDEVAVLRTIHRQEWPVDLPVMLEHNSIFTSYGYIPGEVLTEDMVDKLKPDDFEGIGRQLGKFLAQFHKLGSEIVAHKETKHSTTLLEYYAKRIDSATNYEFRLKGREALARLNNLRELARIRTVVLHGDLHGPNVVINPRTKHVQGVIDLSEVEIGDPHQEFRKIFMTFPKSLEAAIESYEQSGGQPLNREEIVHWAYVNEWANLCHFAGEPSNLTYRRALKHLKEWGQL